MATVAITHTFVDATAAEAAEVNTNFTDLVNFINGSTIHTDGTKAMGANLNMGSNRITTLADPISTGDAAKLLTVKDWAPTHQRRSASGGTLNTSFADKATIAYVLPAAWTVASLLVIGNIGVDGVSSDSAEAEITIDGVGGGSHLFISTVPFTLTINAIDETVTGDVTIALRAKVFSGTAVYNWADLSLLAIRIS